MERLQILLTLLQISSLARRSVFVNTRQLFTDNDAPISPLRPSAAPNSTHSANLSTILDEILTQPATADIVEEDDTTEDVFRPQLRQRPIPSTRKPKKSTLNFGASGLSLHDDTPPRKEVQSEVDSSDAMDWTPTQSQPDPPQRSQHRAFADYGTPGRDRQGFNQAPSQPDAGPFWYKVPPAPINPAQRVRNPPMPHRIVSGSKQPADLFPDAGRGTGLSIFGRQGTEKKEAETVEFRAPQFVVMPDAGDPRNSLADMISSTFNINTPAYPPARSGRQARRSSGAGPTPQRPSGRFAGLRAVRLVDLLILALLLLLWRHAAWSMREYRTETMAGVLFICGTVALRVTIDTLLDMRREARRNWASIVGAVLGIAELAGAVALSLRTWGDGSCAGCEGQAVWLMGAMSAHQLWNAVL